MKYGINNSQASVFGITMMFLYLPYIFDSAIVHIYFIIS